MMSKEEKVALGIDAMWKSVERSVKEIARDRRNAKLQYSISNEEFDKKLNELCEEFNNKYCNMTKEEMTTDMTKDILDSI